jgi:peroxiredoxin
MVKKLKNSTITWVVVVVILFAAILAFNSIGKPEASRRQVDGATKNSQTESDQAFEIMAPDFTLKDLDGNDVKLSDYRGKIVILNFWATWCKYCVLEMPDLDELNKELKEGGDAVIITVNTQESAEKARNFIESSGYSLTVLLDQDGSVTRSYGITGFPTTFIINKDGYFYSYIPGMTNKDTLESILDELLG